MTEHEDPRLKLPIAPRAADFMGNLVAVIDKIENVPDKICWRCYQNINSHCKAFLVASSDNEYEYRQGHAALCATEATKH